MLITGPAYLQNVFLFTLTKSAELLFLFVQGNRPSFGHGGGGLLVLGHLPWSDNSVSQHIDLMVWYCRISPCFIYLGF